MADQFSRPRIVPTWLNKQIVMKESFESDPSRSDWRDESAGRFGQTPNEFNLHKSTVSTFTVFWENR